MRHPCASRYRCWRRSHLVRRWPWSHLWAAGPQARLQTPGRTRHVAGLQRVHGLAADEDRAVLRGQGRQDEVLHFVVGGRSRNAANDQRGRECSDGQSRGSRRKELRRVGIRPPCRPLCMLSSSLLSIEFVPVLRWRLMIGFFPVRPLSLADSSSLLAGRRPPPAGNPSRHLGRIDCRRHGEKPGRDAQSDEALLSGCCR